MVNVGRCTSPMDPMGGIYVSCTFIYRHRSKTCQIDQIGSVAGCQFHHPGRVSLATELESAGVCLIHEMYLRIHI